LDAETCKRLELIDGQNTSEKLRNAVLAYGSAKDPDERTNFLIVQGEPTPAPPPKHSFKPWQRFCSECREPNDRFKDEMACKHCGQHTGSFEDTIKMKACPNCSKDDFEPITPEAIEKTKRYLKDREKR